MASFSREIILTSSPDRPIAAHDPLTGATLAQFSGSRSPRRGLALAGANLIAASHVSATTASGFIRLYNWWSSTALQCIPIPEPIAPIASTLDGSYLFSGGLSGQLHIHSLPSGNLCRSFRAHRQPVSCITTNEDGSLLITGGDDGTIAVFPILRLLDASYDEDDPAWFIMYQFHAHSLSVTSIASGLGGGNTTFASSSLDGTCKFWSMADGTHIRTILFSCAIWCITIDSTYSEAYAGGSNGKIHIILLKVRGRGMAANDAEVVEWGTEQSGGIVAVAMANENRNLVSALEDGTVRIWDVENGSVVREFGHEMGSVSDLIVAKGVSGVNGGRIREEGVGSNWWRNSGFCGREICRQVRGVEGMNEWLSVAVKGKKRAIDMLEASIGTYERLLRLLLKEAKGGGDGKEEEPKDLQTTGII